MSTQKPCKHGIYLGVECGYCIRDAKIARLKAERDAALARLAALPVDPAPGYVRARIAVGVSAEAAVLAVDMARPGDVRVLRNAMDDVHGGSGVPWHVVCVTADVPLPPASPEVMGRVVGGEP